MMTYSERTSLWYDSFWLKWNFPKIIFFIFSNFFSSSSHSSHNHHFCFLQGELIHMRWLLSLKVKLRWGSERVNSIISNCSSINNYWIDNIQTIVMYSLNSVSYYYQLNSFHIHFLWFSIYLNFSLFFIFLTIMECKIIDYHIEPIFLEIRSIFIFHLFL